jgi:hypothetical protein
MEPRMQALIKIVEKLEAKVERLADAVEVNEEHTCENYNALTELNEWKDKVDDLLEEY